MKRVGPIHGRAAHHSSPASLQGAEDAAARGAIMFARYAARWHMQTAVGLWTLDPYDICVPALCHLHAKHAPSRMYHHT